jgi:hypothetical protein
VTLMARRLFVAFHGGANYSPETDATEYSSLRAASAEYHERGRRSYFPCWGDPTYVDERGRHHGGFAWYVHDDDDPRLTTDDDGATVFDTVDAYPDVELTIGPRGGHRWERVS